MKVGIDTVEISRFAELSQKFLERVYAKEELEYISKFSFPAERLAGFFCAKEAALKALGKDISKLSLSDVVVTHDKFGAPKLIFKGEMAKLMAGKAASVSISHSKTSAVAIVVVK